MQRILEAFGEIDERYWTSAMSCERCRRRKWIARSVAVAACLCLLTCSGMLWKKVLQPTPSTTPDKYYWYIGDEFMWGSMYTDGEGMYLGCTETTASVMLKNTHSEAYMPKIEILTMDRTESGTQSSRVFTFDETCIGDGEGLLRVYLDGTELTRYEDFFIPADGQEHVLTVDFRRAAENYEYVIFMRIDGRPFVLEGLHYYNCVEYRQYGYPTDEDYRRFKNYNITE